MSRKLTEEECAARRERNRLRAKKRREEHPEKIKASHAMWKVRFPGRAKAANAAWRAQPGSSQKTRNAYLKRRYGITVEQEQAMLQAQNKCCAICGTDDPGKKGWHVDHSHVTKAVRAMLCPACNKALAFAKDSPTLLRKMAIYLEQHGHT
jgi:hypothetical protein